MRSSGPACSLGNGTRCAETTTLILLSLPATSPPHNASDQSYGSTPYGPNPAISYLARSSTCQQTPTLSLLAGQSAVHCPPLRRGGKQGATYKNIHARGLFWNSYFFQRGSKLSAPGKQQRQPKFTGKECYNSTRRSSDPLRYVQSGMLLNASWCREYREFSAVAGIIRCVLLLEKVKWVVLGARERAYYCSSIRRRRSRPVIQQSHEHFKSSSQTRQLVGGNQLHRSRCKS